MISQEFLNVYTALLTIIGTAIKSLNSTGTFPAACKIEKLKPLF